MIFEIDSQPGGAVLHIHRQKKSTFVWDDALLEKFLANPESFFPDTTMAMRVADKNAPADLIAFLKTLGASRGGGEK